MIKIQNEKRNIQIQTREWRQQGKGTSPLLFHVSAKINKYITYGLHYNILTLNHYSILKNQQYWVTHIYIDNIIVSNTCKYYIIIH